jgi:DNA-binding response OmpR family regulator
VKRVLLIEDEPKIVQLARDYLKRAGFTVDAESSGNAALARFRASRPDLIVLDLGLPGMDGLDLLRALRQEAGTPVIILTARGEESDRIVGLELGADDYMVKPFSPRELVARVRAVLRTVGDQPVELTATEFELLAALARQPGRVFTRSQLLEAMHGVAFESYERAIDTHIKNLRRKIEADPRQPRYIQTVYGVGYRLTED